MLGKIIFSSIEAKYILSFSQSFLVLTTYAFKRPELKLFFFYPVKHLFAICNKI